MSQERDAISQGRGKWSQPGVPHKGWVCVSEYDTFEELGDGEFETCGMCESAQVRFVHVMENDRYDGQLACGCICAGHMAEDLQTAEARDKQMRSKAGRRERFPKRAGWKMSAKGTPHIKVDGFHMLVFQRKDGFYGVGASRPGSDKTQWGSRRYKTVEAAQKGCFDAWQHLCGE